MQTILSEVNLVMLITSQLKVRKNARDPSLITNSCLLEKLEERFFNVFGQHKIMIFMRYAFNYQRKTDAYVQ
jgi:hypothetical protein